MLGEQVSQPRTSQLRMVCPHCGKKAVIRSSRELSVQCRELYLQCQNYTCGHTWKSMISIVHTIVQSRTPNPEVHIPLENKLTAPSPSG